MKVYNEPNPLVQKEKWKEAIIKRISSNKSYDFIEMVYNFVKEKEEEEFK